MSQKLVLVLLLALITSSASGQDALTWSGRWTNRKFGTSGPLKCVASQTAEGKWSAKFTGTFQGDPFEYQADFGSQSSRQGLQLAGQSRIGGHQYQWTGMMSASQLRGQYRNNVGYNGNFILNADGSTRSAFAKMTRGAGNSASTNPAASSETSPAVEESWDPLIQDGERLLFLGNSFMANEGGVQNYFAKALAKKQVDIATDQLIAFGKPLKAMLHPTAAKKIDSSDLDAVVITSGDLQVMKQFDARIKKSNKKTIVFMTWDGKHPGNNATKSQYTASTKRAVRQMRQMEKDTGAIIIPCGVLFHSLTLQPPDGVNRIDFLWQPKNVHQNELGTLVNAWLLYAILMGDSPVGINFDAPPYLVGQRVQSDADIRLTRDLRLQLQQRVWQVAQAWRSGRCHLE